MPMSDEHARKLYEALQKQFPNEMPTDVVPPQPAPSPSPKMSDMEANKLLADMQMQFGPDATLSHEATTQRLPDMAGMGPSQDADLKRRMMAMGQGFQSGGQNLMRMSDQRTKTNIRPAQLATRRFLDAIYRSGNG